MRQGQAAKETRMLTGDRDKDRMPGTGKDFFQSGAFRDMGKRIATGNQE
ncbi:hypothetical protein DSCOOX_20180 [Desulfosarcina ovata subsp. ovata]|uniref:Uncharacterized protein n=1 Tax=Desulfosarcina ovata subsp. ovata TaxID=2752305 RepID=A0A5K8A8S7_9BACT|nr:hypothetical protein DSCOOX_20180 [Desulfosarcina ovata subsp. ovata]